MKKIIGKILYKIIAVRLPESGSMKFAKKFRGFCAGLMILKCGKNVNVEKGAYFGSRVVIGDNSGIGVRAFVDNDVEIGRDVMMGPDCVILTKNHMIDRLDIPMWKQGFTDYKKVVIENDVWIGTRVIILPGVHIGSGSVIGAGSIVTHDVEDNAIVAGNPAKLIRYRGQK